MWEGSFTREDCNQINLRVETEVLLLKGDNNVDILYTCWKNAEKVLNSCIDTSKVCCQFSTQ